MRYKLLFLLLLLEILLVCTATVPATDLRGGVVGVNLCGQKGPCMGLRVALFGPMSDGTFGIVRQAVTGPDGLYYFSGVYPGEYVLQVGGLNYPLTVGATQIQDIPILAGPRLDNLFSFDQSTLPVSSLPGK
jgi:hypothetical protein